MAAITPKGGGAGVLAAEAVDPPLYALSWNLKNSHVFSGSF